MVFEINVIRDVIKNNLQSHLYIILYMSHGYNMTMQLLTNLQYKRKLLNEDREF